MEKNEKNRKGLVKAEPPSIQEALLIAPYLVESGMFPGITSKAQAVAKILLGRELGIGPVSSLQLIDVVQGRLRPRSQLIATLLNRSGRYSYKIEELTDTRCQISFFANGQKLYTSVWTIEDARRAKILKPDGGWDKYPREMLFARAMSAGATKVCPELLAGYEPLEIEGGYDVVDGAVVPEGEPPPEAWAAFWAFVKGLGREPPLTGDEVHQVLGVNSLKEWLDRGQSLAEALAFLEKEFPPHKPWVPADTVPPILSPQPPPAPSVGEKVVPFFPPPAEFKDYGTVAQWLYDDYGILYLSGILADLKVKTMRDLGTPNEAAKKLAAHLAKQG